MHRLVNEPVMSESSALPHFAAMWNLVGMARGVTVTLCNPVQSEFVLHFGRWQFLADVGFAP
jgi:hypothetical protein